MSALIDYIQIEIHKTYNKKYSKKYIEDKLIPIINYICSSKSKKFLFGGSQGIGKSSFINIITKTIEKFYNKKILLLSLDNYYLSKKQRLLLSKQIHQLLITRGVPGTHDIEKLFKNIKQFNKSKYPITTPLFDKLIDDISKSKNRPELVIGFAAETDDLIKNAKSKLNQKGCDIIVANKIDNKSSVFGNLENKVSIISNDKTVHWPKMSKAEIGEKLSDLIENH